MLIAALCLLPLQQLFQQGVPFLVYQKQAGRCSGAVALPAGAEPSVRVMQHNLGRECAGYLRYIVDHYDDLPRMTAFLQMGSLMHMPPMSVPSQLPGR